MMKLCDLLTQRLAFRDHTARMATVLPHQTGSVLIRFGAAPDAPRITLAVEGNDVRVVEPEFEPAGNEQEADQLYTEADVAALISDALAEAEAKSKDARDAAEAAVVARIEVAVADALTAANMGIDERIAAAVSEATAGLVPAPHDGEGGEADGDAAEQGETPPSEPAVADADAATPAKRSRKAKSTTE